MQEEGITPNQVTFVTTVQACSALPNKRECDANSQIMIFEIGQALLADARKKGFASNVFIGNSLLSMYGKSGHTLEAENVFIGLFQRDIISWNSMLSMYVDEGSIGKAFQFDRQMLEDFSSPNQHTFLLLIKACGALMDESEVTMDGIPVQQVSLDIVHALHAEIQRGNFISDVFLGSTLLQVYGKCENFIEMEYVFDGLCANDVVSWSALISVYADHYQEIKALQAYTQMHAEGIALNQFIVGISLQACSSVTEKGEAKVHDSHSGEFVFLEIGRAIYADALRRDLVHDVFVANNLINMYGKHGSIMEARIMFRDLVKKDVISWMLSAFLEQDDGGNVLRMYSEMQGEGVQGDVQTILLTVKACGDLAENQQTMIENGPIMLLDTVLELHNEAYMKGFTSNTSIMNTLIITYSKCGNILEAENIFAGLSGQPTESYNTILSAYVHHGLHMRSLRFFKQMREEGKALDEVTLLCALEASRATGCLEICRQVHFSMVYAGLDIHSVLGSALILCYGAFGLLADIPPVFAGLPRKDITTWNSCFACYTQRGDIQSSLCLLEAMQKTNITPNRLTLLSLLSTCRRAGLLEKAIKLFKVMCQNYEIIHDLKLCVSVIDILGRGGEISSMESLFFHMPNHTNWIVWMHVLDACHAHGSVFLGKQALDALLSIKPRETAACAAISKIDVQDWI